MPYPFLPAALGASFLLMWAFIGGMILRDGQIEVRRRREREEPLPGPVFARRQRGV
mgnify:FL=1